MNLKPILFAALIATGAFAQAGTINYDFSLVGEGNDIAGTGGIFNTAAYDNTVFNTGSLTDTASHDAFFNGNTFASSNWATNTSTIVTATDQYSVSNGNPIYTIQPYGNTYSNGWNNSNGDSQVLATFGPNVTSVTVDFWNDADNLSGFIAYSGVAGASSMLSMVHVPADPKGGSYVSNGDIASVTYTASAGQTIGSIIIVPGSYFDYAGVSGMSITTQAVPEPKTIIIFGIGALALIAVKRRQA